MSVLPSPVAQWDEPPSTGAATALTRLRPYLTTDGWWIYLAPTDAVPGGAVAGARVAQTGTPLGNVIGAVGYWPFDDNTATDQSGAGNHGILRNGPTFAPGYIQRAVLLDGLNDYVEVPSVAALKYTGGDFTIATWVWIDPADATLGYIFSKPWNGSGEYNWQLRVELSRKISLVVLGAGGAGASATLTTPAALSSGAWHRVLATVDAAKNRAIWIDGVRVITSAHTIVNWVPSLGDTNLPLAIGTLYPYGGAWAGDATMAFQGMLDDVRIYTRVLADAEILADYAWLPGGFDAMLTTTTTGLRVSRNAGGFLSFY